VDTIIVLAQKLWRDITTGKQPYSKIHNISLAFHGLTSAGAGQKRIEGFLGVANSSGYGRKRGREDELQEADNGVSGRSFTCDRCSKRISLPDSIIDNDEGQALTNALEVLKMEHADYHFARDLAQQGSEGDNDEPITRPPITKKKKTSGSKPPLKRKEPPQGIARYFGTTPSSSSKGK